MVRWEHYIWDGDDPILTEDLAELGDEGWELVSHVQTQWSREVLRKGYTESGTVYTYAFKRPKPEPSGSAPCLSAASSTTQQASPDGP